MKTLFERLRPEQRERLQELKKEMPITHKSLVKSLQYHKLITTVPFGDVVDIVRFLVDDKKSIGDRITAIYDYFENIEKTGDDSSLQSDHNAQTTNT